MTNIGSFANLTCLLPIFSTPSVQFILILLIVQNWAFQYNWQGIQIANDWIRTADLWYEATALPIEPQPLPYLLVCMLASSFVYLAFYLHCLSSRFLLLFGAEQICS